MSRDTSFYYSFLVLPPRKRNAIIAVWDFCRAVDDAVDEAPDETTARTRLSLWRDELAACYTPEGMPHTPQGNALKPCISEFDLPRRPFEDLIDGVEMDLAQVRYQTFAQLADYCRRVASAVGLVCVEIFGYRDAAALKFAANMGQGATHMLGPFGLRGILHLFGKKILVESDGCEVRAFKLRQIHNLTRSWSLLEAIRNHRWADLCSRRLNFGYRSGALCRVVGDDFRSRRSCGLNDRGGCRGSLFRSIADHAESAFLISDGHAELAHRVQHGRVVQAEFRHSRSTQQKSRARDKG